jgi:glycosyltransferase involved in cell wall biosynthesis
MLTAFSLLIPSYNRPGMIREAVDSLIANQSAEVEIIVGDDASPRQAEIRAAVEDYIALGRVQFLAHQQNGGWSENRNALVAASRGEWVILMGDDDRLKPGAVSRMRRWMSQRPGYDIYAFGYDIIDSEGCFAYGRTAPRPVVYRVGDGPEWEELFHMDAIQMWSHHPFTMAIRRSAALANPFDAGAGIADDILFQFRLLIRGGSIFVIPESLFEWRFAIDADSGYQNLSSDNSKSLMAHRQIWLMLLREPALPPAVSALLRSPQWLRRFLKTPPSVARRISARAVNGDAFEQGLSDPDLTVTVAVGETNLEKLGKMVRVSRVFGWVHLLNVGRYFLERHLHRSRRRGLANPRRAN